MKTVIVRSFLVLLLVSVMAHVRAQRAVQDGPFAGSKWITANDTSLQVPVLWRDFAIAKRRKVRAAHLFLTSLGLYEASVNGKRLGRGYFAPGWTNYLHRLQYQAYDVSGLLRTGKNRIDVLLNPGWFSGAFGAELRTGNYGKGTAFAGRLEIIYDDGSREEVCSDERWKCSVSYINSSGFYEGEFQDTRLAGFHGGASVVKVAAAPGAELVKSIAPPVTAHEVFEVVKSWKDGRGGLIVDFGQNIAGFLRIGIRGRTGDTLRIEHAEMTGASGGLFLDNLRKASAKDKYILNGKDQVLEPHFTYHGFRYARISGAGVSGIDVRRISAVALYTDLKRAGSFSCSDPMLNRLQSNILWSMRSNFVDVPTDCPQRSERFGWTGDAQVFVQTAAWNYDVLAFYKKYLADLALDQGSGGGVPNIVPDFVRPGKVQKTGTVGWGDAAVLIPWRLYQVYGDRSVLEDQYESMKGWVDYVVSRSKDGLWQDKGYGDWYAQGDSTSVPFIDQCFFAYSASLVRETAGILGDRDGATKYGRIADLARRKFMECYGDFDCPSTSTQTAYLLALAFDLLPQERRDEVAGRLVARIERDGGHLATGFLGTPFLLPVLSRFGYGDLAYRLLFRKEFPSWMYPLSKGATTIWEKWDAIRPDGSLQQTSFNHFAYGAVGEWFYSDILGIRSIGAGFKKVSLRPLVGGGLSWARGSYASVNGKISVSWKVVGKKVLLDVEVPRGVSAEVRVPGIERVFVVGGGKHSFTGKTN